MKFLVTLSLILVATASNLRSSKIKVFNAIEPDDPDTEGWYECGLIAQEVEQIPELTHAVTPPKSDDR